MRADPAPKRAGIDEGSPRLLFGDLHVHSSYSFDAFSSGVTAPPRDAYRYARGEAIAHVSGEPVQLAGPPLDFLALTDHAEYLGVPQAAADPGHVLRQQPLIEAWTAGGPARRQQAWKRIQETFRARRPYPALVQDAVIAPAWQTLVALANAENRPGTFTTFIGFEYTSNPGGRNLHRNVLFRGAEAPTRPFSAMDSANPEALWRWMDAARAEGYDALAIPHNANGSDGRMFARTRFDASPLDAEWIALRARNEPVAEIFQIKGSSDAHPALSPNDPWADFEIIPRRTLWADKPSQPKGSYLRDAFATGLALEAEHGANPYRLGVVASTDGHNAASPFEEDNYSGKIGRTDGDPRGRLAPPPAGAGPALAGETEPLAALVTRWGAAGLAGVWAEANTRAAIFDAIRRRETFGTSGPRIRVRVGARWQVGDDPDPGGAATVPMGGVLGPSPTPEARPRFDVTAQRDPRSGRLERIQIVKGWRDASGHARERVFDIACASPLAGPSEDGLCPRAERVAPPRETRIGCDPDTAPEIGANELQASWIDPDPEPPTTAFYQVRVLEVPTCRWSTREAQRLDLPRPQGVPARIQERAVTSPVWVGGSAGDDSKR